ncbi:MAG: hypothetical protein RI996_439, partial [Candidatus Parcubacteria bacterium]
MQVKIRTQQVQRAAVHKTTARTYTRVASSDIYTRTLAIPS